LNVFENLQYVFLKMRHLYTDIKRWNTFTNCERNDG